MSEINLEIEACIQSALVTYSNDDDITGTVPAREFDVPEQRLSARYRGRVSLSERVGPGQKLNPEQEKAIYLYLDRLDEIGTSARYPMLMSYANSILSQFHMDMATPSPVVSNKWSKRFLARHPEYSVRKQKTLDVDKKNAHQPNDLAEWFEKFQREMLKNGVTNGDCYNMNETEFTIEMGKNQWIVTKDRKKQSYLPNSNNRESFIIVETISGDGEALPPMIILSGIVQQKNWCIKTVQI